MTGGRQADTRSDRKQRLGAALRANLQRRKVRQRSQADEDENRQQPQPPQVSENE